MNRSCRALRRWRSSCWSCGRADGFREAYDLLDGFALHVQSHQQRADLRIGAFAVQDFRHDGARLVSAKGLAMVRDTLECVQNHFADTRLAPAASPDDVMGYDVMGYVCPIPYGSIESWVCCPRFQAASKVLPGSGQEAPVVG